MIKGIPVELLERVKTGVDEFNAPVYSETWVTVENVLPGSPSTDDVITATELYGKKATYILAIPKGDAHEWEDTRVRFFGKEFRTFGNMIKTIDALTPTAWNGKIYCEAYHG